MVDKYKWLHKAMKKREDSRADNGQRKEYKFNHKQNILIPRGGVKRRNKEETREEN
jgi:hypothetical protein